MVAVSAAISHGRGAPVSGGPQPPKQRAGRPIGVEHAQQVEAIRLAVNGTGVVSARFGDCRAPALLPASSQLAGVYRAGASDGPIDLIGALRPHEHMGPP